LEPLGGRWEPEPKPPLEKGSGGGEPKAKGRAKSEGRGGNEFSKKDIFTRLLAESVTRAQAHSLWLSAVTSPKGGKKRNE